MGFAQGYLEVVAQIVAALAHGAKHGEPVGFGHDEVEDHQREPVRRGSELLDRTASAVCRHHGMPGPSHRGLEEAALDGIVIDDEDRLRHEAFARFGVRSNFVVWIIMARGSK